jgi:hypothetical protein
MKNHPGQNQLDWPTLVVLGLCEVGLVVLFFVCVFKFF